MKLPYSWLTDLVNVPAGVDAVASALALRGFEVASVESGVITSRLRRTGRIVSA